VVEQRRDGAVASVDGCSEEVANEGQGRGSGGGEE
jgi:hypothetical protein